MNWYKRQLKIADRPGRKWTEDELKIISDLLDEGNSYQDVSSLFGVSGYTIRDLSLKYKWREPRSPFSPEQIEKIKRLVLNKISFDEVGRMFGVSGSTIQHLNKRYRWRDIKTEKDDRDKMIVDLYLLPPEGKGMSMNAIAKQYGIYPRTIQEALKRLGLSHKLRDISEELTRIHELHPEISQQQGEAVRRRYIEDPQLRERASEREKQKYIDNPEIAGRISETVKNNWENMGGLEGRLLSYPHRSQAVNFLMGFVFRKREMGELDAANRIFGKYMQIINNHTYPEEVNQGTVI
jgi:transposase